MDDSITLTNISQEFISKALTLAGTFYQSCDVYNLACSRNDTTWMNYLCQFVKALIGYGDDAQVWFDSTAGGAATGMLSSGAEKGVDAEIPIYTELELALTKPLSVVLSY